MTKDRSARLEEIKGKYYDAGAVQDIKWLITELEQSLKREAAFVEALEKCRHDECIAPHFTFKCKCPKCEALNNSHRASQAGKDEEK